MSRINKRTGLVLLIMSLFLGMSYQAVAEETAEDVKELKRDFMAMKIDVNLVKNKCTLF